MKSYGSVHPTVLHELTGLPWDENAQAYLSAFNPTSIRVSTGELTCDARPGRATVIVDRDNLIRSISLELQAELPDGIRNGHELRARTFKRGLGDEK